MTTAHEKYLIDTMRRLENVVWNTRHGGASKDDILISLELLINEYKEDFNIN